MPDFWGLNDDAFATDPGAWRARWGVDNTVSHSGKRSLRIVGKKDLWELQAASVRFSVEAGKPYTLSAWMKSDLPDLPVTMKLDNVAKRQFTIDKTWKRYIIENVVPAGNSNSRCIINNDSDGGTLWIDDVQLECSTVATDYKPGDTDKDLTGRAVHCVSRPADCPI